MLTRLLVLVILFAGLCHGSVRIVGGTWTSIEYHPSLVQVDSLSLWSNHWSQICGANILNNLYVLSAAHCFAGELYERSHRRIRAGTSYRNFGGVVINIDREFNHPSYGLLGFDGDISVVRLASPLTFSPVIQQCRIPAQGTAIPDGLSVVHAGWGATSPGGPASTFLLDTQVYTVNNDICRQRYLTLEIPGVITRNMICAGLLDVGGRGSCQGDSGGPLLYGDIVIGIVSAGYSCATPFFPGVNTNVASYTNWIVQIATQ